MINKTVKRKSKTASKTPSKTPSKNALKLPTKLSDEMYSPSKMVGMFLRILNIIKLFHWKTRHYSIHKATDELYSELSERIDTFVEQLMGTLDSRIDIDETFGLSANCDDLPDLINYVTAFKKYMENMSLYFLVSGMNKQMYHYDLSALRDEIVGIIDKFLYLVSLK
jgi:hypothetical protein